MSKYYEVMVQMRIETEDSKGEAKIKKVKELYLVDAMSVTEAEARVIESFNKSGFSQEFSVISVRSSKVIDVIHPDEKPR
jgi:phosphoribosylaminoimidazole carboxylase (NCAIR synthetase)